MSNQVDSQPAKRTLSPMWVYVFFLLSFFISVFYIAGGIMCHFLQKKANASDLTHYRYQAKTFWISNLIAMAGLAVVFWINTLIGIVIVVSAFIYLMATSVIGMKLYLDKKPI